jgi:hypothetical protein
MNRGARLSVLVLAVLVAGILVSPTIRPGVGAAEAATAAQGDTLALHFRGVGNQQPAEQGRFQWSTDLYSLVTGEKVGTGIHNVSPPAPIMDHVITFRLPDGDLVAHSKESVASDPQHQGFFLIGIHAKENNIVPARGTGAYAGRTGRVTMSGRHDGNKFPEQVGFNDFYLIELDPRS